MRELKINIYQTTAVISILYINNAFFGFIKDVSILNAFCLLCMFLWLVIASKKPGFLQNCFKTCTPLIIYTIFLILVYLVTSANMGSGLWQNLRNAIFSLICSFLCLYILPQDKKTKKQVFIFLMVNILLGCAYTLYRIQENPLLPRILARGSEGRDILLGGASTAGVLTYGEIYGIALIIPSFLFWISRKQGQKKIFPLIIFAISIVTIFKAQFAIALIFSLVGIALYLIMCGGLSNARFIISGVFLVVAIIVAVNWDSILSIIYSANILPSALQQKAHELLLYSEGGNLAGTNLYSRSTYYAQSFKAIAQNNFVGKVFSNNASGAGHSEWEDMAANYGIIAPILVYSFFRKFTKNIFTYFEGNAITVYRIQLLIFLIIGFVDPIFHSRTMSFLLFLSPLILTMYEGSNEEESIGGQMNNN